MVTFWVELEFLFSIDHFLQMYKLDSCRQQIIQATLSLSAVSFHYTSYLMATALATQKKKWAKWTQEDEKAFLEFLVEHCSKAEPHGQFKGHTIQKAVPVFNHKYDKTQLMSKWNNVSILITSEFDWTYFVSQLKSVYQAIEGYRGLSGVHWDNERGAGINPASASSVQVFDMYCATLVMIN